MSGTDVLVIGGGPAGATVAACTARAGARVVLLERDRLPRDKVCGEFVSAGGCEVLSDLGVLETLVARGATRMDACRLSSARGRSIDVRLPAALGVSRRLLDAELLDLARRLGTDVRERTEAVRPIVENGIVRGVRARPVGSRGDGRELRARVVIAADGRRSSLVRALHPHLGDPRTSAPGSWFGIKTHFEARGAPLGGRVELHLYDGGYAGLSTVEGGRINLCAMVTVRALQAHGSPDGVYARGILANPEAARRLRDARRDGPWKTVGPLRFGVRRPVASGVIFVGDAAGTIDPFCGEGIANALRAARMAARHVLGPVDVAAYEREWLATFAPVTGRVRHIGRLFARPALAGAALSGLALLPRVPERLVAATRTG